MRMSLERWLQVLFDTLFATLATGFTLLLVLKRRSITGSQIGIAFNMILIATTTLLRLIQSWTAVELALQSVARIDAFKEQAANNEDEVEMAFDTPSSLNQWPKEGRLILKGVNASYG
jgi:hypothetical protein